MKPRATAEERAEAPGAVAERLVGPGRGEPLGAGAAREPKEERLRAVVGVVAETERADAARGHRGGEP